MIVYDLLLILLVGLATIQAFRGQLESCAWLFFGSAAWSLVLYLMTDIGIYFIIWIGNSAYAIVVIYVDGREENKS